MNRRGFLQRLGLGVTGALVLAHVPAKIVQVVVGEDTARLYACEYLRKVYNDYAKGRPLNEYPRQMIAGRELFQTYEGELSQMQRFTVYGEDFGQCLMFKGVPLRSKGAGWYAKVVA